MRLWATRAESRERTLAISGIHVLLHTPEAEALRATLRDIIGWRHVDSGDGWLIFALPPAELGVHPTERPHHELSLMCDDIDATVTELRAKGIEFRDEPHDVGYGIAITMLLPGEVEVTLYEPRHETAL